MYKPTLTVVSADAYLARAEKSFSWSPKSVEDARAQVEKRNRYAGAVVKVNAFTHEHRCSDYSMYSAAQTVTVWDAETGMGHTFDAFLMSVSECVADTLWAEDATEEARAAYKKWYMEVAAPAHAAVQGEEARKATLRSYENAMNAVLAPKLERGQVWKVVRGRKYPHGVVGKVFWWGNNKWGMSVGLATTERKNEKGHFVDSMFVSPDNLEYMPTAEDLKKVEELRADMVRAAEASAREAYDVALDKSRKSCPVA